MSVRGRVFLLGGFALLLALAGCGRSMLLQGERASWRHQAEVQCLKSGEVKVGSGIVQLQPIEGPGMCGADFPLKVAALGESTSLAYGDEPRPPAGIRNASQMPYWPPGERRYDEPPPPAQGQQMRWVPGPPAIGAPQVAPPEVVEPQYDAPPTYAPQYNARPTYAPQNNAPAGRPVSLYPQDVAPPQYDDIPDDAVVPPRQPAPGPRAQPSYNREPSYDERAPYNARPAYNAPAYAPAQQQPRYTPPALGPSRGPASTGAIMPAAVTPAATLSCPIVSALDRWVSAGVQPAAQHWFGTQVTEIKQISAYSCRSMVGAGTSHVSEHAFGNALDIAGFVFADGRKIMVQDGWHGSPEEQGFLHDVQLYACETFTTVLAPGYNAAHYNHIHVDLMRRSSGRRPCRPDAIPGEVVAAKARAVYASRHRGPNYTGSIPTKAVPGQAPMAVPGEDGYVADEDGDETVTGSIPSRPAGTAAVVPGADGEFDDDVTGSIAPRSGAAREKTFTPEDRLTQF